MGTFLNKRRSKMSLFLHLKISEVRSHNSTQPEQTDILK